MVKPVKRCFLAVLLMLLMTWRIADAAAAKSYDITLASQSQNKDEWQNLVRDGLAQVIERVSGDTSILQGNPQVKQALTNAADFVEQYAYEGNTLTIKYSADLVNQLIHKMGRTTVKQKRSNVVLWLAIEDKQQRRLIGVESDPALQNYLNNLATQKEISLILPLMDLEDISSVTVTDVWGQFPTVLQQASMRYDAQSILVGRVMHHEENGTNRWESSWELLNQSDIPAWKAQGQTLEEVLTRGFSLALQHLKGNEQKTIRNVSGQKGKPFFIAVEDILSSTDFHKVDAYLRSLEPVVDVNISQVLGTVAIFEITPRGENGRQFFSQTVNQDHQLIAVGPGLGPGIQHSTEVEMTYRWGLASQAQIAPEINTTESLLPQNPSLTEDALPEEPAEVD